MSQEKFTVVIPIYKTNLTQSEKKSLWQCLSLLGNYKIAFIHPKKIDIKDFYINNIFEKNQYKLFSISFDDSYFDGVSGYNRLLLSQLFYSSFEKYQYILIYQLDAWVFKDEIEFWLSQGYDYIGAPWVNYKTSDLVLNGVGNGGLSLRRVSEFLRVLRSLQFYWKHCKGFGEVWRDYIKNTEKNQKLTFSAIKRLEILIKCSVKLSGYKNNLNFYKSFEPNEDTFWGLYVPKVFRDFKIPCIHKASRFSIESNAQYLMSQISPDLPFGCHAWEKWDRDFWQPYINESFSNNKLRDL